MQWCVRTSNPPRHRQKKILAYSLGHEKASKTVALKQGLNNLRFTVTIRENHSHKQKWKNGQRQAQEPNTIMYNNENHSKDWCKSRTRCQTKLRLVPKKKKKCNVKLSRHVNFTAARICPQIYFDMYSMSGDAPNACLWCYRDPAEVPSVLAKYRNWRLL